MTILDSNSMLLRNNLLNRLIQGKPFGLPWIYALLLMFPSQRLWAQWEPMQVFPGPVSTVYFLDQVGHPEIGFISIFDFRLSDSSYYFWRTEDSGKTWVPLNLPPHADQPWLQFGARDFTFKDSANGWMANFINFRTTDAGLTWTPLGPTDQREQDVAIFFSPQDKLLFSSYWAGTLAGYKEVRVSTDEGITWKDFFRGTYCGYSFSGQNGIITSADNDPPSPTIFTTDGGVTWAPSNFFDESYQPTCIPGTTTFFAASEKQNRISRSFDGGKTWQTIYTLSLPYGSHVPPDSEIDGCIRSDRCGNLYAASFEGFLMSSDEGNTWHSIGGPAEWNDMRFWITPDYIYAADSKDLFTTWPYTSRLWRYRLSNSGLSFSNGSKKLSIGAGNTVSVKLGPSINATANSDSVHIVVRYDSLSLALKDIKIPAGWSIIDSSRKGDSLNLSLKFNSIGANVIEITFNTFLVSSKAKIYLDSLNFYGTCPQCTCSLSTQSTDSIEIDFTGCGDSTILAAMHGELPFIFEGVTPNPACNEINIQLSTSNGAVAGELFDMLGYSVLETDNVKNGPLEVGNLPSGTYYLRLSSGGYVVTRRVIVEH